MSVGRKRVCCGRSLEPPYKIPLRIPTGDWMDGFQQSLTTFLWHQRLLTFIGKSVQLSTFAQKPVIEWIPTV